MPGLILGCLALAALSLLLPSTPTYDPWAWIIWGREVVELDLDTRTGPSWKPLAVMFTAPFAVFGDSAAPELWLILARAGALLALAMAFRLARRLAGEPYGVLAGTAAAAILLISNDWIRNAGLGNSEGLLVALLFWAALCHLDERREQVLYLGFAAALLRPEVWPFLGLYWLWLWAREPQLRVRSTILMALIPAFWLIPELIGSGDAFRASTRAQTDIPVGSPALEDQPWRAILESADRLVSVGGELLALGAVLIAALTRPRQSRVLWFALATAAWVVLVIAMTEAGYSGNQRYLVPAGAAACVLAGV
ncbi:MAG: hypothetical protein H0V29_00745, partial [Thermoleophilaceae bacterium]|nr:hypothetical protein [Thermoleophilaceae bacterium]